MSRRSLSPSLVRTAMGAFGLLGLSPLAAAQAATAPHWSTYFGGSGFDSILGVQRGLGTTIVVVGTTLSQNLGTAGAMQPNHAGNGDAFVACLDPMLPPSQQLQWCTYLGGSGMEIGLDLDVQANGIVTVVGLTDSADFPITGVAPGFQPTRNGPSDGFVARLSADGSALLYATYFGGSSHDRCNSVRLDGNGVVVVGGTTESLDLPGRANTLFPNYHGGLTDGFVARIDPAAATTTQLLWATYVGGPDFDGTPFFRIAQWGGVGNFWEGVLRRQSIAIDGNGHVWSAHTSTAGAPGNVTPGCFQPNNNWGDHLIMQLHSDGNQLLYGTYCGGTDWDNCYGISLHPAGGVVVIGDCESYDMPVTAGALRTSHAGGFNPTDAHVCWIDPGSGSGAQQLRYGSYLGGSSGDDGVYGLAVDSAGLVTIVGSVFVGAPSFPTTVGSLQASGFAGPRYGGLLRLRMKNQNNDDLVYGTLLGDATRQQQVLLDALGDAYVVGATTSTAYPTQRAMQTSLGGAQDAVLTHLPMLPGGTERQEVDRATPACSQVLHSAALGEPKAGNASYTLCATNAPVNGIGVLAFGAAIPAVPFLNIQVLVNPIVVVGVNADALGFATCPLPIPASLAPGFQTWTQWAFLTTPSCPGSGPIATTERLQLTTL